MKAKEYFIKLEEDNLDKSIDYRVINTLRLMVLEIAEIKKARRISTVESLKNLFKEQNQKARSFVNMVNNKYGLDIIDHAFLEYIKIETPDLYNIIIN